jgi:hypothetical protein
VKKKSCVDNFPVERFCHFRALNESAALMYSGRARYGMNPNPFSRLRVRPVDALITHQIYTKRLRNGK